MYMDYQRTLVMACATVIEEMLPFLPDGMQHQIFDFGLHINPEKLRIALQEAIDAVEGRYETILLGYGLCSQAIIGLRAARSRLVVPRVDDCIAIFLGSRSEYQCQAQSEPGTYYLTKGWIEVGSTPFTEFEQTAERLGKQRTERIYQAMLANYKRLALINTGQYEMDRYRDYARRTAERFHLRYEEIPGSDALVKRLLFGPWEDDFVVVQPGEPIRYDHFFH
jgi:hypothetical protein